MTKLLHSKQERAKDWQNTCESTKLLDRCSYLGRHLREGIIYFIFLICLTVVACLTMSTWTYWYSRLMTDLFIHSSFPADHSTLKTFPQIITHQDFWQYMKTVFGRNLWYDLYPDNILEETPIPEQHTMRNVLFENRLIGLPRMRQLQVRNNSCEIFTDMGDLTRNGCFGDFCESHENRRPFGVGSGSPWVYSPDDSMYYIGQVSSYPNGGYKQHLSANYEDFMDQLDGLRTKGWITRNTRAVFVDLTTYNVNVNLFCFAKLVFEWPPVGGIVPSWHIISLKLLRYVQAQDFVLLLFEIILLLFLLYFTWRMWNEWKHMRPCGCGYLPSLWTLMDLLLIVLGWLLVAFYLLRLFLSALYLTSLLRTKNYFADFVLLIWTEELYNCTLAALVFVAWFKLFKYMNLSCHTSRVFKTLSLAKVPLLTLLFLFIITLTAFALCEDLLMGPSMSGVDSSSLSIVYMWGSFSGFSNDFSITRKVITFLFTMGVVIFGGLMLAILLDSYSNAKLQDLTYDNYGSYLKFRWRKLIAYLRRDQQTGLPTETSRQMNYDDILDLLRKSKLTENQITQFTRKFQLDPYTCLDEQGVDELISNIEREEDILCSEMVSDPSCSQMLEIRLCEIENNMLGVDCKMDQMISRIEHLQKRIAILELIDLT